MQAKLGKLLLFYFPPPEHRGQSAPSGLVAYFQSLPPSSKHAGRCKPSSVLFLVVVANKDRVAAAAVSGARRHTHNRRQWLWS
jgi:hypothetical protein